MRSLFNLTMILTLLGTSLITPIESTIAAPAPIFRPIIKEIEIESNELSKQQVINAAKSMAKEPPIRGY